ncbi:MAG TPA: caspase family protein [Nitrospira sp.]
MSERRLKTGLTLRSAIRTVCAITCLCSLGTWERPLAQEGGGARRALLIGIDRYTAEAGRAAELPVALSRRHWKNLKGAVNDVRALRELLIHRQGFRPQDILVLENEAATRDAIFGAFQQHLIAPANAGDHSIFYYAGHGSRVRNSRSMELDGKDETIVPADANRHAGDRSISDIRDKEWDRLFTEVLDRGAWLTAIFDSCHSGSISRSAAPVTTSTRFLDEDDRDVAELLEPDLPAHAPGMEPERRDGALIISAVQEDQQAKETLHVSGGTREWHGAFSLALMRSLNELPPHVGAVRLFDRVTARLLADGYQQEPVLSGTVLRRHAPLFGGTSFMTDGRIRINLIQAYAVDDVEMQGGAAIGLTPDSELLRVSPSDHQEVRIQVTDIRGLGKSRGRVIKGDWRRLHSGDELELVRKGTTSHVALPVWIPPGMTDLHASSSFAQELANLAPSLGVSLVADPTISAPTHVLTWDGSQWMLWSDAPHPWPAGKAPRVEDILNRVKDMTTHPALFVSMPPTNATVKVLNRGRLQNMGVAVAATPDEALYMLSGRFARSHIEYAWVSTRLVHTGEGPVTPLPARSVWSASPEREGRCESGGLVDCLTRLAKLHYWLTIMAPPGEDRFPYRLAFKSLTDGRTIERGDLSEGRYRLVLRAEPSAIERIRQGLGLQSRFVYVFAIGQEGGITQLFPNAGSREREHLLPHPDSLKQSATELTELSFGESGMISVHAPFGTDTYLVITSAQAIPNLGELLEADPVAAPPSGMRGANDWSIDRLFMRSVAAAQ